MHPLKQFILIFCIHVLKLNCNCFIIIPSWFWNTTNPVTISPGPQTPISSTYLVTRTTCTLSRRNKNNNRSSIDRVWFDRKHIYLRVAVAQCKGIRNPGNFSLGIWNPGLWNLEKRSSIVDPTYNNIGTQNLSSTVKESRMQYPWRGIENPRLSDSLAWDDHCFQLDKVKDIICFHYFLFATRKNSHNH